MPKIYTEDTRKSDLSSSENSQPRTPTLKDKTEVFQSSDVSDSDELTFAGSSGHYNPFLTEVNFQNDFFADYPSSSGAYFDHMSPNPSMRSTASEMG